MTFLIRKQRPVKIINVSRNIQAFHKNKKKKKQQATPNAPSYIYTWQTPRLISMVRECLMPFCPLFFPSLYLFFIPPRVLCYKKKHPLHTPFLFFFFLQKTLPTRKWAFPLATLKTSFSHLLSLLLILLLLLLTRRRGGFFHSTVAPTQFLYPFSLL